MRIIILSVIMCILLSQIVLAIGLTGGPLKVEKTVVPGSELEYSWSFIAHKENTLDYTVSARDVRSKAELAKYVSFDQSSWNDLPPGSNIPFTAKIKFPTEVGPPGKHEIRICAAESCESNAICARASVCARMIFKILYPGIYPELSFTVPNVNENAPLPLTIDITNEGTDTIKRASGYVDIFNLNEEKIGTVQLTSEEIGSEQSAKLSGIFDTIGVPAGNYSATAHIDTDGKKHTLEKSFRIGNLDVTIKKYSKKMNIGGIQKVSATVGSNWGDPLDVYATILIYDDEGNRVSGKSSTIKLAPWKDAELEAFIDTTDLEPKEYNIRIEAFFAEKSRILEGKIDLIEPSIVDAVTEKPAEKTSLNSTTITLILVIVVIILTLINVFLAIYRKKK